jgi:hypothetical protein
MMKQDSSTAARASVDLWHMSGGVRIWAARKLRQPYVELNERDGPLRVVLLADYEALSRLYDETVRLLKTERGLAAVSLTKGGVCADTESPHR